jgi:tetratricopeptide (TPR) repeat protein/transcriptional regulator with XRE-family HTH domain
MKSFSQLLSEYINRIGVSDAELARRLGVSRQTVFRWREGTTRRPRHREDVLRLAAKLRLEPEERDLLLIAAGFQPEGPIETALPLDETKGVVADSLVGIPEIAPTTMLAKLRRILPRYRWALALVGVLSLGIIFIVATGLWRDVAVKLGYQVESLSMTAWPSVTSSDETLVLVSEFANYGGGQIGYNIAGRIQEALQKEFREAGLEGVRIERLPEIVTDVASAQHVGREFCAALVVWGEYDSGRVIAVITAPMAEERIESREQRWLVATSEELSSTINTDLPRDVRWISLYVLGHTHFGAGRRDEAEVVFQRALIEPPEDPRTVAGIYFFLGLLARQESDSDLDEVIAYYTEAIERFPEMTSALNNRGLAYLNRGSIGDLERAEIDFRMAMACSPGFAPPVINLAFTLLQRDPGNLREALSLLEEVERQQPASADVQNALCWYHSLAGRPEDAIPHCDQAVELDPSGYSNDSRGLTLALLGRYEEAVQEFRAFLEKLRSDDIEAYDHYAPSRQAWIEVLEGGRNPFDASVLQTLLQE